jgi:hypothetical protein
MVLNVYIHQLWRFTVKTESQSFDHQTIQSMTRREFLALGTLSAVGLALSSIDSSPVLAQGIAIAAYHDATGAAHQKQFDANDGLAKKGYRIISLSVYRNAVQPLYAAVWIKGGVNKATVAFHGLSSAKYQQFFDTWYPKGFRPVIVSATGGGIIGLNETNSAIFAGVFEKDTTSFVAKHDINHTTFKDTCTWAKQNHYVLRWGSIYGGKDRLYAGVWEKVAANVEWDYQISIAIDGPDLGVPATMPNNPALRLAFVTRSPFAEYLAVYRSDQVAVLKERHGMTSSQYQTQFDLLNGQGYYPLYVQAGGDPRVSDTPRFVALFKK